MKAEGLQRKRCFATLPRESSNVKSSLSVSEYEERSVRSSIGTHKLQGQLMAGRWTLQRNLGSGSQGTVWEGIDIKNGNHVAVKISSVLQGEQSVLEHEAVALRLLGQNKCPKNEESQRCRVKGEKAITRRVPDIIFYGPPGPYIHQVSTNSMQFELLVQTYFDAISFASLGSVCDLGGTENLDRRLAIAVHCGQQILSALEYVHDAGLIHGDVSMANILVAGFSDKCMESVHVNSEGDTFLCCKRFESYIVDFGMCTNWADAYGHHEPANFESAKENHFNGTMQFASLNVMLGLRPSRRDDIVSLMYCLAHFIKENLPWSDCSVAQSQIKNGDLVSGCPESLQNALDYSCCLKYDEKPDYGHLRRLLDMCSSTKMPHNKPFLPAQDDFDKAQNGFDSVESLALPVSPTKKIGNTHKILAPVNVEQTKGIQENIVCLEQELKITMDTCISPAHLSKNKISVSIQQPQKDGTISHVRRNFSDFHSSCSSVDTAEIAPLSRRRRLVPDPTMSLKSDESDCDENKADSSTL